MNRSIAYTSSWLHTLLIGCILALVLVFIIIFLQPFDSYASQVSDKMLKLSGYGICLIVPIQLIHIIEEMWFKHTKGKWYLYQEVFVLVLGLITMSVSSFYYNVLVVNDIPVNLRYLLPWSLNYGLPFAPIIIPIWAYLRLKFSKITITASGDKSDKIIQIEGNKQQKAIQFKESQFILAQAQANYVDIYYIENNQLQREMIRHAISALLEKIPSAQQIHRSYLVNPAMITHIEGNTRQGSVKLKYLEEKISISPKHFNGVKKYLQNRP